MSEETTFKAVPGDPAIPGDPFVRLRYHYGMLLGAEDFSVEQREKVLRRRLHQALLHGVGTVWGLRVVLGPEEEDNHVRQLAVRPGLAVDSLGRDIYVDARQCLDVSGLARNPVWNELERPPGACDSKTRRRAYVVLRYEACQSLPVPAIAPPCNEPGDAVAYSRLLDRFRVDLAATAPEDPHALAREWLAALLASSPKRAPRDVLLDFLLGAPDSAQGAGPPPLARFFSGAVDAPLLLATVDLDLDEGTCGDKGVVHVVGEPQNGVRSLLPSLQSVAESLFGTRLSGPAPHPAPVPLPFQAVSWSTKCNNELRVRMTRRPHMGMLKCQSGPIPLSIHRLGENGWEPLSLLESPDWDEARDELILTIAGADLESAPNPITFHLWIAGESEAPLVAADGAPLMGLVGDPITHARRGRDVSILDTWKPIGARKSS
ncbi:hypothetical protein [Sorangium sp. So ce1182]|uniref:hypothetical protein n=1 Tax=Sorangium sp. So ce1182 TaxID=3133334 RepID=UPI003F617496